MNSCSHDIHVGMVKYIDYALEQIGDGNLFLPFLHKRKSFEHERELGAVVWLPLESNTLEGLPVNVDLDQLIDRIFIAPTAPLWVRDIIEDVTEKYGVRKDVIRSGLAHSPIY